MRIAIAGAGPAGLLLAHSLLQRRNYDVHVFEKRGDPRRLQPTDLRTFPISLQQRAWNAVATVPGLQEALEQDVGSTWINGILIHNAKDEKKDRIVPRSPPFLTIDRNNIVLAFLNHFQPTSPSGSIMSKSKDSQVTIHFDSAVEGLNLEEKTIQVVDQQGGGGSGQQETFAFDHLVATDGARSAVREILKDQGHLTFDQQDVRDDYRSIYFSDTYTTTTDKDVKQLATDKLHGWFFGDNIQTIGALVHPGICSGAFIFAGGKDPFADMMSPQELLDFLTEQAPVLAPLVTMEEAAAFLNRPTSTLTSVRISQMNVKGTVLLIGDSAHAVSASIGQGCNSALQDVQLFIDQLDKQQQQVDSTGGTDDYWDQAVTTFAAQRLPEVHALVELSYYGSPPSKRLRIELLLRTVLRSLLPKFVTRFMRPLPMDFLTDSEAVVEYETILEKTQWWVDRVKRQVERLDKKQTLKQKEKEPPSSSR